MSPTHPDPPDFADEVHDVLAHLAPGQVVSYSWVADEAGHPGAARAVGRYLRTHPDPPSWWRVVAADGRLVSPSAVEQADRLRAEGHTVVDGRLRTRPEHPGPR